MYFNFKLSKNVVLNFCLKLLFPLWIARDSISLAAIFTNKISTILCVLLRNQLRYILFYFIKLSIENMHSLSAFDLLKWSLLLL